MKKIVKLCSSYIKDSNHILKKLNNISNLPSNARFFTADANSMYTNIDTPQGIEAFGNFLQHFHREIPDDFPTELFLQVLNIVMTNNVFELGDKKWLQLTGTAMGTSCACMYSTIVYTYHEKKHLLPLFQSNILLYARFMDDILGIWIESEAYKYSDFKTELELVY